MASQVLALPGMQTHPPGRERCAPGTGSRSWVEKDKVDIAQLPLRPFVTEPQCTTVRRHDRDGLTAGRHCRE